MYRTHKDCVGAVACQGSPQLMKRDGTEIWLVARCLEIDAWHELLARMQPNVYQNVDLAWYDKDYSDSPDCSGGSPQHLPPCSVSHLKIVFQGFITSK